MRLRDAGIISILMHLFLVGNPALAISTYQIQTLDSLGGQYTWATAINDTGQISGYGQDAVGRNHPFLWENGELNLLDNSSIAGFAFDINNQGVVIGRVGDLGKVWDGGLTKKNRTANWILHRFSPKH